MDGTCYLKVRNKACYPCATSTARCIFLVIFALECDKTLATFEKIADEKENSEAVSIDLWRFYFLVSARASLALSIFYYFPERMDSALPFQVREGFYLEMLIY